MALSYFTAEGSDDPGVRTFVPAVQLLDRTLAPIDKQLRVAVEGEELAYGDGWTWDETLSAVTLGEDVPDLADDDTLVIWRETRQDRPWVQPTAVARMRAVDLMNYWTQILYIVQDLWELTEVAALLGITPDEEFENLYNRGRQKRIHTNGGETLSFSGIELLEGIPGELRHQLVVEKFTAGNWVTLTYDATPDDATEYSVSDSTLTITIGGGGTADKVRIRRSTRYDEIWIQLVDGFALTARQISTNQNQMRFILEEVPVPARFLTGLLSNPIFPRGWNYLIYSGPGSVFSFDGSGWSGDGTVVVYVNDIPLIPGVDYTIDIIDFEITINIPLDEDDVVTIIVNNWTNWNYPPEVAPGDPVPPPEPGDEDDLATPVAFAPDEDFSYNQATGVQSVEDEHDLVVDAEALRLVFDMSDKDGLLEEVLLGFTEELDPYGDQIMTTHICNSQWEVLHTVTTFGELVDGWVTLPLIPAEVMESVEDGNLYVMLTNDGAGTVSIGSVVNRVPEVYPAYLSLNGAAFPTLVEESTPVIVSGDTYIVLGGSPHGNDSAINAGTGSVQHCRTIMVWDLSAYIGETIDTDTSLFLKVLGTFEFPGHPSELALYECKRKDVNTAQATWSIYSTGNNWQAVGALGANDYDSTEFSTAIANGNDIVVEFTGVSAKIQEALDVHSGIFAIIIDTLGGVNDNSQIRSLETALEANRPYINLILE